MYLEKLIDTPIKFSFRQEKERNETLCTAKEFCGICVVDYPLQVNWIIFWFFWVYFVPLDTEFLKCVLFC